jgi:hypothetical protein
MQRFNSPKLSLVTLLIPKVDDETEHFLASRAFSGGEGSGSIVFLVGRFAITMLDKPRPLIW